MTRDVILKTDRYLVDANKYTLPQLCFHPVQTDFATVEKVIWP